MDVRPGYKQTEVGVIPEDWGVKPFQSLAHIERGKFTARPRNDPKYYGGEIPFIQTGDVTNSRGWIRTYSQTLNPEGLKVSKLFPRGTLFFTIAANIGDVGLASFATACPDSLVSITPVRGIDKHWLAHELGKRKPLFENLASHNAQLNISLEKLKPYLLPVPTLAEQEAIAEALSDADALIESLEQLLTKKRQIRKGAMQELLAGKKRLPGFSGKWKVKRLGKLGGFLKGSGVTRDESASGSLACVRYGELYTRHNDCIKSFYSWISREVAATATRLEQGDILFAGSGETKDEIGKCAAFVDDIEAYAGGDIVILRSKKADPLFLGYYLNTGPINRQKASKGQGDAVVHISAAALADIQCALPCIPEQTAIATILSDMDAEIAALEARLSKARQIKQGMMQELLTGRTRLV